MKIYRVVYRETGSVRSVWTSYRSACGSSAQARSDCDIHVAHVADDAWAPVDKRQESKLAQIQNLWWALGEDEATEALELLQAQIEARRTVLPPKPTLSDVAKAEATALLELDRLVDAQ